MTISPLCPTLPFIVMFYLLENQIFPVSSLMQYLQYPNRKRK